MDEVTEKEFTEKLDNNIKEVKDLIDDKFKGFDKTSEKVNSLFEVKASEREEDKLNKGGFANIADFSKAVASRNDPRMKEWAGLVEKTINESVSSEGGFLVPPEFSSQLWQRAIEESQFFERCFKIPTTSNEYHLPALVDESHASSLFGGVNLYYKAEEAQYTASAPKFRDVEWRLNKLTGLTYISDEMLEDSSQNMNTVISQLYSKAMGWQIDKDILTGSGVGKPLGINTAPSIIEVAKTTGQVADTITYQNLVKMWVRAWRRGNTEWVTSSDALDPLMQMTIEGGTASTPVWIPSNDASRTPNGTIFGRPILETEHCAALGDSGDIYLVDFSQYGVAHKNNGGIKTATSMHLKFDYDQLAFKISFRWDGQSMWNSAFQPDNSHSTKSPFIKLAERA